MNDSEVVDLIILTRPLGEIDREIRTAQFMLGCKPKPIVRNYWEERLEAYEQAGDVAEFCFENDIPTCDRAGLNTRRPPQDYRVVEMLGKMREFDDDYKGLTKQVILLKNELSQRKGKEDVI